MAFNLSDRIWNRYSDNALSTHKSSTSYTGNSIRGAVVCHTRRDVDVTNVLLAIRGRGHLYLVCRRRGQDGVVNRYPIAIDCSKVVRKDLQTHKKCDKEA